MSAGRYRVSGLFIVLAAANAGAWAWAWLAFGDRPALLGTALLAWIFGLRHALDADHIAAIDNIVRRLMQTGRRPYNVGLAFSLGHSTVVVLACAVIASVAAAAQAGLAAFQAVAAPVATLFSALFLLGIAAINLWILRGVWHSFRLARHGAAIADVTPLAGPLSGLLRPVLHGVTRGWQMYAVGFLFGLGFDTATEVGLLGISALQAVQGLAPWQTLVFAALFTSGMALVDTADSVLMVGAYGWAFVRPLRKLWYNLTITAASVLVAVLIGGIEVLGLLGEHVGMDGAGWRLIARLNDDMTTLGLAVVGVFALCWVVSALVYRWKRYDHLAVE